MDEKFVIINGKLYNTVEAKTYIKEAEFSDSVEEPKPEIENKDVFEDNVEGVFTDWVMYERYLESCKETIIVAGKAYFMNMAKAYDFEKRQPQSADNPKEVEPPEPILDSVIQKNAYKNVGTFKNWTEFFFSMQEKKEYEPASVKDAIRIVSNGIIGQMHVYNPDGSERSMVSKVEVVMDANKHFPKVKLYEVNAKLDVKTHKYEIVKWNPLMADIHNLIQMAVHGLQNNYSKDTILEILQDINDIIDTTDKDMKSLSEQEIKDKFEMRANGKI